jgi:hypothetical protein
VSATNAFESQILSLVLENANAANIGDATGLRGSTVAGVFYVSLHTATLTETSVQNTSESTYTNYLRVSIPRSTTGWTVTGNTGDNDSVITFAQCGATGATLTDFGLGSDSGTAAGNLFLYGALTAPLVVSNLVTPSFAAGALDITLD